MTKPILYIKEAGGSKHLELGAATKTCDLGRYRKLFRVCYRLVPGLGSSIKQLNQKVSKRD